jgi:NAD(P)H-flavin reductase
MVFIYSNKTKDDILLHEDLTEFQRTHGEYISIHHTLTRHNDAHGDWQGIKGRITKELLVECKFPEPSEDTLIAYCGPAAFNKTVEDILLNTMGYTKDMLHKF